MKKLFAMDIGNSRTGFALFSGKRLGRIRHVATHDISDVASAAEFLKSGIASGDDIKAAWVASVVPQKNRMVATALRNLLGIDAHIMTPRDVPMPVEGYDLSQIGIDRLINAFAAYDLTKSACIVVDAGSCITFDCVSDEGVYLGGAIVPGLGLSMSAMHLQTAKIPRIDYRIVGRAMGKDTESSVRAGIHFGYAGLAANLIEKLTAEMGGSPSIVVTGGDANFIAKVLSQKVLKKPSLIFEGIIKAVT